MSARGRRRVELLEQLAGGADVEMSRVAAVCRDVTGTTGAGIMVMSGETPHGSIATTDEVSALVEQAQYDYGEGPCIDAFVAGKPVSEPDLAAPGVVRWMAFTPPVLSAGVRALFGFPLRVGAARLGALNLYRDSPGPLTDAQHADGLIFADITARAVLLLQAGAAAGQVASELEAGADFHLVVHQAAGMVSGQLDVAVAEALVRLRAHAFGSGRPLTDVARDIVARRLRMDTTDEGSHPT